MRDAVRGTIGFTSPEGKQYKLNDKVATLLVRPRGWHLNEKHLLIDGKPMSGSLFDFGLYFFHNAKARAGNAARASTSTCPRWRAISRRACGTTSSCFAQNELGMPQGTVKATVLIETILAAFEMDEILYELREHSRRPQLRALGLHLQLHQEIPEQARTSSSPTAAWSP